jgi:hypothetical protein
MDTPIRRRFDPVAKRQCAECALTPYGQNPQIPVTDGIGGWPYGPGTLAGPDGSRQPVEAELTTARNLGSRLARVAGRLKDLRVRATAA